MHAWKQCLYHVATQCILAWPWACVMECMRDGVHACMVTYELHSRVHEMVGLLALRYRYSCFGRIVLRLDTWKDSSSFVATVLVGSMYPRLDNASLRPCTLYRTSSLCSSLLSACSCALHLHAWVASKRAKCSRGKRLSLSCYCSMMIGRDLSERRVSLLSHTIQISIQVCNVQCYLYLCRGSICMCFLSSY